jgi:M6 family metalloprotease-like protein
MKKRTLLLPLAILSLLLSGCSSAETKNSPTGAGATVANGSSVTSAVSVSSSDSTQATTSAEALEDSDVFKNGTSYFRRMIADQGRVSSPSAGNVKALVIPVVLIDYASVYKDSNTAGTNLKAELNTAFFGTSEDTDYWESLTSYYYKSSYGKMNITGTVTDFYYSSYSTTSAIRTASASSTGCETVTDNILTGAYDTFFTSGKYNYSDYDSNGDGVIDLVWLVYCNPHSTSTKSDPNSLFWAFTSWCGVSSYSHVSNYSWASFDFMEEGTSSGIDAHTYIHETGHQLGLDDYYSYDSASSPSAKVRSPLGCEDMMDFNIGDHCSFSKYCLAWITPEVGQAGGSYTLKPFESSGDSLIIASDFNGTCFDEYFIVEYYTPTGLNKLDAESAYSSNKFTMVQSSGLRIIHVDQRLGKIKYVSGRNGGWAWDGSYYDNVWPLNSETAFYEPVSSNTASYCLDSSSYALVSLVQASGKTNLMSSSASETPDYEEASDLFTASSKIFGQDVYGSKKADEGWSVPYSLVISQMDEEGISFSLK